MSQLIDPATADKALLDGMTAAQFFQSGTGYTYDDFILLPGHIDFAADDVSLETSVTRRIKLKTPILSSPMDTVTESAMAIALAQEGGLGVIHKNMSLERQTDEVNKVKRSAHGIIVDPVTLPPEASVATAHATMLQSNVSGIPIVKNDRLVGIITRRDLRFLEHNDVPISEVMTKDHLVTAQGTVTLEQAEKILMAKKVEKLLLVDENNRLTGLITIKDIDMMKRFPQACKDRQGRLRVGAAVGVFDFERAAGLIDKGTATRTASQIAETIDFVGGSLSAGAGVDWTSVSVTVLTEFVDTALAVLSDIVVNPSFPGDELENLRRRALTALQLSKSQPAAPTIMRCSPISRPHGSSPVSAMALRTFARATIRAWC